MDEVFGNILNLRECHHHLLGPMYVRQREQGGIISKIGDIFLNAVIGFQSAYPTYIGQLVTAERRLKEELEHNREFREFLEVCAKFSWTYYQPLEADSAAFFFKEHLCHPHNVNKMDLIHWLNRPSEHLNTYPVVFEAILEETPAEDPDVDFLKEAVGAMRNLQLKTFQTAMGKGPMSRFEWHDLVPGYVRSRIPKQVAKRQAWVSFIYGYG